MAVQEKHTKNIEASTCRVSEKFYLENTLLRVSGALFCHDAKRAGMRTQTIEINRGDEEKRIVIEPHPNRGQPGPLAHKIFVALIKKHSDYGRPIPDEVSFTKREIMNPVGRSKWGGSASSQLSKALDEIATTYIRAFFKKPNGTFVEDRFNIFSRVLIERRSSPHDPVEACTVTLARPIIDSLRDRHFTCLNHTMMMQLGTIGQALYMRFFFHFANVYEEIGEKRMPFSKRYDDICNEWLGGLKILDHKSKIINEQLGSHLAQLINVGFLSSFAIEKAKQQPGFVLIVRPGATFFADYNRFYRNRNQGEIQWNFHADRRDIAEPLKVACLFTAKRLGVDVSEIADATSSDVESARNLLVQIPFEEASKFLDYALARAQSTNFNVQTLGGLKQYIAGYVASRKSVSRARTLSNNIQRKQAQEALQAAYASFRRQQARDLLETLPEADRKIIELDARAKSRGFTGTLAESMFDHHKATIVAQRYADKLDTFEQWRASRLS